MADKDLGDGDGPSLEMPSLGSLFKRKKKPVEPDDAPTVSREELDAVVRGKRRSNDVEADDTASDDIASVSTESGEAVATQSGGTAASPDRAAGTPHDVTTSSAPTSQPVESTDAPTDAPAEASPVDEAPAAPEGATPVDETPTAVVPDVEREPDTEHTTVLPGLDERPTGAAATPADDAAQAEPAAAAPAGHDLAADGDADRPLFADEVTADEVTSEETAPGGTTAGPTAGAGSGRTDAGSTGAHTTAIDSEADPATPDTDDDLDDLDDLDDAEDHDEAEERAAHRSFALPALPGRIAAAITGLVVGLLAVAMTYLAVQGCEKVKGTSSCGTPGFFLLIAIMILLVVLGSSLLKAWQLDEPNSTSFLAVGVVAVIALLFLIRVIFSPWMIVVIPLVAVAAFVGSQWLTSLFAEEESESADESSDAPA